jgi:hypothetical protein
MHCLKSCAACLTAEQYCYVWVRIILMLNARAGGSAKFFNLRAGGRSWFTIQEMCL